MKLKRSRASNIKLFLHLFEFKMSLRIAKILILTLFHCIIICNTLYCLICNLCFIENKWRRYCINEFVKRFYNFKNIDFYGFSNHFVKRIFSVILKPLSVFETIQYLFPDFSQIDFKFLRCWGPFLKMGVRSNLKIIKQLV